MMARKMGFEFGQPRSLPCPGPISPQWWARGSVHAPSSLSQCVCAGLENSQLCPEQTRLHQCRKRGETRQEPCVQSSSKHSAGSFVGMRCLSPALSSLHHLPLEISPLSSSALPLCPRGAGSCWARAGPGGGDGLAVPCAGKRPWGCPPVPASSRSAPSTQRLGAERNRCIHFTRDILSVQISPGITESKLTALLSCALPLTCCCWGFAEVQRCCRVRCGCRPDTTFCTHTAL